MTVLWCVYRWPMVRAERHFPGACPSHVFVTIPAYDSFHRRRAVVRI